MDIDVTDVYDDNVYEIAKNLLDEVLSKSDDDLFILITLMGLCPKKNQGFKFIMLKDSSGKETRILYQTAMMRDNFERFSHLYLMDMMKRGMNLF